MCAMPNEIEEIQEQAAGLTGKLKIMLERRSLTAEQDKKVNRAYCGLLFWRRTELALMIKEFGPAQAPRGLKETK